LQDSLHALTHTAVRVLVAPAKKYVGLEVRCLPTASTLPLKNRDLGTSRWQLKKAVGGTYISAEDVGRGVASQER